MKISKLIGMLLIGVFVLTSVTSAQRAGFGASLKLGFPQGEFKDNVDRIGFGGALEGTYSPYPNAPFAFGLNLGYMNYGDETRQAPLSTTIPDLTVNVNRVNNLANFHLLFKIIPPSGYLRPYADLLVGGSYLWTETSITQRYGNQDTKLSDINVSDWAFSYGAGAGLLFQVYEQPGLNVFVDLKGRYLNGSEAKYLTEGSVKIVNGAAYYDFKRSRTDLVTAHLGVYIVADLSVVK